MPFRIIVIYAMASPSYVSLYLLSVSYDLKSINLIHISLSFLYSPRILSFNCFLELEPDARADVAVGNLAYWPAGPAFCIFFGPTPVSTGDQPRAYSPVNVFGRVSGDTGKFKIISAGAVIKVTLVKS